MHPRNVELFCEVAARHSFSRAAEVMNVSQSMVSQAVGQLEKQLGTLLIDRSKRPLELTAAGKVYFDGCRSMLRSYQKLKDRVQGLADKVTGRLNVAAIYSVGLLQMDAYINKFHERYPEVNLTLNYLHPDEVYARVRNNETDLGIVSFPRDGGDLQSIPWQDQPMVLAVPADHPLSSRKSVDVETISSEPFVAFVPELRIRRRIDRWLKDSKVNVKVVHEFDNIENIKRAVEIGAGITILPKATLRRELKYGSLTAIELNDIDWVRPLGLVHKRHKNISRATECFIELLQEDIATAESTVIPEKLTATQNGNGESHITNNQ